MKQSPLRLVKRRQEHLRQSNLMDLPRGMRGIYVLYRYRRKTNSFNVVYVGMARSGNRGGIRGRLNGHRRKKGEVWTHCSVFEVWDNIRDEEVIELEGLFRHIYALDSRANMLNAQRSFRRLKDVPEIII